MGIFTMIAFLLPLTILAGIYEGSIALYHKVIDALEWRAIRKEYYPRRKAWMM